MKAEEGEPTQQGEEKRKKPGFPFLMIICNHNNTVPPLPAIPALSYNLPPDLQPHFPFSLFHFPIPMPPSSLQSRGPPQPCERGEGGEGAGGEFGGNGMAWRGWRSATNTYFLTRTTGAGTCIPPPTSPPASPSPASPPPPPKN